MRNPLSRAASVALAAGLVLSVEHSFASDTLPASPVRATSACTHEHAAHFPDDSCDPRSEIGCGKAAILRQRFAMGLPPTELTGPDAGVFTDREALTDTDVLNNNLDIAIDPTTSTISGSNTITLRSLVDGLTQFTFMLRNNYTVSAVQVGGVNVAIPVPPPNGNYARTVTLNKAYNAGEEFTVRIVYSGVAVNVGLGSIFFTTQNGVPVVSTLSQPYYAGTWWPAKDGNVLLPGDNLDKATWTFALTTPSNLVGVSNGAFQGVDTLPDGRRRWRYASSYPMSTYLACFSATNYNQYSIPYSWTPPGGGPTVSFNFRYFLYPASDTPANRANWEQVLPMMDAFQPVFGPYPFAAEGYGMYQFPFSGGMEHQTMTGQGVFITSVTAHELGHQWWGDHVTCRFWNDIWFNEGLATYSEAIWEERRPGSTGQAALSAAMNARKPTSSSVGASVYQYTTNSVSTLFSNDIVYRKAAWVWHMMRGMVGDTAFYAILAHIRSNYGGSAITTAQIQQAAETVTGMDFTAFFNEWVYNGGAPNFASGVQALTVNGKTYARFHIRQTQVPTYGVFTTPIDVRLNLQSGSITPKVRPSGATSWFVRATPSAPTTMTLDPNNWILNYAKTSETYLQGPPVVLEASPTPGTAVADRRNAPSSVQVVFSENMNLSAGNFEVTRSGGATVPFTMSFNPATLTATLTFDSPLSPSDYSVALVTTPAAPAAPTAVNGGRVLDGEISSPNAASGLPSGNGQAGGVGAFVFSVASGPCPADLNNDNQVDNADFVIFADAYNEFVSMGGDLDGDGLTDNADFVTFSNAYATFECP